MKERRNGSERKAAITLASTAVLALLVVAGACAPAEQAETEEQSAESAQSMEHAELEEMGSDGDPRVFFVSPQDGDTVTSPVTLTFGSDNFEIEPVGDGEIHHGAGHFHIGVNTDCLDPGIVIPQAAPWVHFGDGSSEIDMQLPAGETKLTLQIGDGEHRTLEAEGLCQSITVTVLEGEEDAASETGS